MRCDRRGLTHNAARRSEAGRRIHQRSVKTTVSRLDLARVHNRIDVWSGAILVFISIGSTSSLTLPKMGLFGDIKQPRRPCETGLSRPNACLLN
eukprot:scaffold1741_cov262-Pinguiococcus_pyrenoidosus.AAC.48